MHKRKYKTWKYKRRLLEKYRQQIHTEMLKIIFTVCVLFFWFAYGKHNGEKDLATGFAGIIYCTTGRNPLDYNNYGCYCGLGGNGIPVDNIDRCCQAHDDCYGALQASSICWNISVYAEPYIWSCNGGHPNCSSNEMTVILEQILSAKRHFSHHLLKYD